MPKSQLIHAMTEQDRRIVLLALGTRGDVQPVLAVAVAYARFIHQAAQRAPHSHGGPVDSMVTLVTHSELLPVLRELVSATGRVASSNGDDLYGIV